MFDRRVFVVALRALWASAPLTVGPAFSDAAARHSSSVRLVLIAGAWALWAMALFASFVPRVATLTPVRSLVALAIPAALWAAFTTSFDGLATIALAVAIAVTVVALTPHIADAFIDGSSYGDERRFALRPQAVLLLGPIPFVWAVGAASIVTGPILLAARQWIAGVVACAVGGLVVFWAYRALSALAQRWLVMVPAGVVLRDYLALAEPTLFPRASIASLGPAPVDDIGLDLTVGASGLALQLRFAEPVSVAVSPRRRRGITEPVSVRTLTFAPSRPGAVVAEAKKRRIALG